MHYQQFAMVGRETLQSVLFTVGPVLIAALAVGLVIGMVQAATSINEATLTFVPKLVVVAVVLALSGPFMVATVSNFFQSVFTEISRVGR
jgi:flagellar biosynthetic protein FliQ